MLPWWVEFDDELSWLFTNRLSATKFIKVKRMGIKEILRMIWLFSASKIKWSESFSKQPTQLIVELNSSLRHIIVPKVLSQHFDYKTPEIYWFIGAKIPNAMSIFKAYLSFQQAIEVSEHCKVNFTMHIGANMLVDICKLLFISLHQPITKNQKPLFWVIVTIPT